MWELDNKKHWQPKNRCPWTMMLEKTLESPLDCTEIKPVHPKGDQSWVFISRADAEAEAPVLWPPDVRSRLTGKDPDAGKDWKQEERGTTKDEMVGWYHQLNGHKFEQTSGDSEGQGSLACCSPQGQKESGTTEWLKDKELGGIPIEKYWGIIYMIIGKSLWSFVSYWRNRRKPIDFIFREVVHLKWLSDSLTF